MNKEELEKLLNNFRDRIWVINDMNRLLHLLVKDDQKKIRINFPLYYNCIRNSIEHVIPIAVNNLWDGAHQNCSVDVFLKKIKKYSHLFPIQCNVVNEVDADLNEIKKYKNKICVCNKWRSLLFAHLNIDVLLERTSVLQNVDLKYEDVTSLITLSYNTINKYHKL